MIITIYRILIIISIISSIQHQYMQVQDYTSSSISYTSGVNRGGVEMRIATYELAFCFHILLLSLLTVGRFRVSVSPTKDNCPGVNQLEGGMLLVPTYCSTF